jgi:4-hydroxybenzoate polyprenyltransferase
MYLSNLLSLGDQIHEYEHSRWRRTVFRLVAAVPPIIAASYVSNLSEVTDFTGILGFSLAFIFPGFLGI